MHIFLILLTISSLFLATSSHPYNQDQLDYFYFDGVTEDFVYWYTNFTSGDGFLETTSWVSEWYSYYLAAPCSLLMMFHLFILTRRSMATSSTNVFLIAITINDLVYELNELGRYADKKYSALITLEHFYKSDYCYLPLSYFWFSLKWYFEVIRNYMNRCSAWFGLLLTVIRYMAIKSDSQSFSNVFVSPRFGWTAILLTCTVCVLIPILEILSYDIYVFNTITTGPNCPEEKTGRAWRIKPNPDFSMVIKASVDTWLFQIIPSIVVTVFTLLLIIELRRARRRSSSLGSEGVQTTKINVLVFLLAVLFVLVRGLQALMNVFNGWAASKIGFMDLVVKLPAYESFIFTLNTIFHFLICACLSSQYRDTVRKLFNIERIVERIERYTY